ncbi:SDR family NAD(P)-dependent oxidoreductase [Nocardioides sp. 1609]|uniref:SDR family NAD(P)-dependent oxidoreductase n=1 Tax=Nocardioides sp. 1609 TaxID=2508327 RepID=UPI00106F8D68|nr:SDR family NAD(P)-dependent oxidoreductase [Nocardioides sp. 1609]
MTPHARSVRGTVVLVTGAGHGMGRATAEVFAAEGARVAVTDVDGAAADDVAASVRVAGGDATAWTLDVGDPASVAEVVPAVAAHLGALDVVVNNAGIAGSSPLDGDDYEQVWERMLRVNLTAHQRVVRAALPFLRASDAARIVNIASTEALGATVDDSAYAASKAGVVGLTRALALDLGKAGITVNCICPGPIETPMTAFAPPEDKALYAHRRTALRRYGLPEEVAHTTLSLCLPAASYITGAVIPVDGGLTARNA